MALSIPAFLILLILSLLLRVDPLFTVLWFLFGLYTLARLWTRHTIRSLRIERRFIERAFTGDAVSVALTVFNTSRLPMPWLQVSESLPVDLTTTPFRDQAITLGGHGKRTFPYTLVCRKRGLYPLGPVRLETGDILGIEDRIVMGEESRQITVYPRILSLDALHLPTRSALMTLPSRTPLYEDPTRIIGVREYAPSDSPRRIHWTATARTGDLMVKQYEPAIARETLICLDLDWKQYISRRHDATEQAIVVAASLANHMIVRERLPVGLATEAEDPLAKGRRRFILPPRSERGHLMAILEVLARVQIATGGSFTDLVRDESVHLAWGSTILVITGELEESLAQTLLHLGRRGHAIAVILVREPSAQLTTGTSSLGGIAVHRVWSDGDLASLQ